MGWFDKRRESEQRKRKARFLYDFEIECRKQGWGDPAFVYDEEKDFFRWTDRRFAAFMVSGGFGKLVSPSPWARRQAMECRNSSPLIGL